MCYYHETKCPQHQCLLEPVSHNWLHIYPTGVFLIKQIKVLCYSDVANINLSNGLLDDDVQSFMVVGSGSESAVQVGVILL